MGKIRCNYVGFDLSPQNTLKKRRSANVLVDGLNNVLVNADRPV